MKLNIYLSELGAEVCTKFENSFNKEDFLFTVSNTEISIYKLNEEQTHNFIKEKRVNCYPYFELIQDEEKIIAAKKGFIDLQEFYNWIHKSVK